MLEEIVSKRLEERCYKYTHSSGVTVCLAPMEGFSTVNAVLGVKFGSEDNRYSLNGGKTVTIPDGTAHYLEHKLFESPEKGAFERFAETGASCNAGTSYDSTVYYFSCAENFAKNLEILLDFVQSPYFTPENVEKERGIIAQEITMYADSPNWRVMGELFKAMFSENPIKTDIAGTVESIADITDETLYEVYNAYYNPSNMYLSIAGNFETSEAIEVCERCLKPRTPENLQAVPFSELYAVAAKRTELKMPVAKPQFAIGFKRPEREGMELYKESIYLMMIMDIIFGDTSEFYKKHRDEGLLNDAFRASMTAGRGYIIPSVTGESDDPDKVLELVKAEIRKFKGNPPDREVFSRNKKQNYGYTVRAFNNSENVAQSYLEEMMAGVPLFAQADCIANADYEGFCRILRGFDEENCTISIIYPA